MKPDQFCPDCYSLLIGPVIQRCICTGCKKRPTHGIGEREAMIRAAWKPVQPDVLHHMKQGAAYNLLLVRRRPASLEDVPATDAIETAEVKPKFREVTWSAMCEGFELGTYRR